MKTDELGSSAFGNPQLSLDPVPYRAIVSNSSNISSDVVMIRELAE